MTHEYNEQNAVADIAPIADFSTFGLPDKLMQSLNRMKFTTPTPIQAQAIPLALEGLDILGSAQTGTGKTGAFGIPLIAGLMHDRDATALVLTPTRELATQVMETMLQLIPVPNIKTALLIGGEAMPKQFRQLQNRPRLIVGTPGRVFDHINRATLNLGNTRFLVLDETDRMLDMGFGIQLEKIVKYIPSERQTMMFSATMPSNITKLSAQYLRNPQRIAVGSVTAVATKVTQETIKTNDGDKYDHLTNQLETRNGSVIVFVKTKHGADRMATRLNKAGYQSDALHGDLKQSRRDKVTQAFRDKRFRILVATDVAARGLDIPHIENVINYDLPQVPEDYIHRIGRTGRAGASGVAVNLVTPSEGAKWKAIQRLLDPNAKDEYESTGAPSRKAGGKQRGGFKSSSAKPFGKKTYDDAPRQNRAPRQDRGNGRDTGYAPRNDWNTERRERAPQKRRTYGDDPFAATEMKPKRSGNPFLDRPRASKPYKKPFGANKKSGARKSSGPKKYAPNKGRYAA